jgi:hypothetical protein
VTNLLVIRSLIAARKDTTIHLPIKSRNNTQRDELYVDGKGVSADEGSWLKNVAAD